MAKFVKLSTPLQDGEEWALVLTEDEVELIRCTTGTLSGDVGRTESDKIWGAITSTEEFLYDGSGEARLLKFEPEDGSFVLKLRK